MPFDYQWCTAMGGFAVNLITCVTISPDYFKTHKLQSPVIKVQSGVSPGPIWQASGSAWCQNTEIQEMKVITAGIWSYHFNFSLHSLLVFGGRKSFSVEKCNITIH